MRGSGRGYLLVLAAAAAWSTSGLFIRWTVAASGASALSLAFWRDLATFVCLLAGLALFYPRFLRVERRDLGWLLAMGAVGVGAFHLLWNLSILHLGYGVATVLLYASPAFVALMAWILWREPLTRFKILAVAMTLAGCVLVAGREQLTGIQLTAGGLILGTSAGLAWGTFSLLGRQVAPRYSPWTVLTYGFGFGTLALFPFQFGAALPAWPVSAAAWTWFACLVLFATILPFGIYVASLKLLPVSIASIVVASEVAFGSLVGYLIFDETLGAWQFVGAALVVAGVALVSMKGDTE